MNIITLHTKYSGPAGCSYFPASHVHELTQDKIVLENISFRWEQDPDNLLYIMGNDSGAIGAAWARSSSEIPHILRNAGILECLRVENPLGINEREDTQVELSDAGEVYDLSRVWIVTVDLRPDRDATLLRWFATKRGRSVQRD